MIYLKDKTLVDLKKQQELSLNEFLEAYPEGDRLLALHMTVGCLEYIKVPQSEEDIYELKELALHEGKNHSMRYYILEK